MDDDLPSDVERNYFGGRVAVDGQCVEYKPTEIQVGGTHYQELEIQPIEYVIRNNLNPLAALIIKYITRAGRKGDAEAYKEDLKKATHCIGIWEEYIEKGYL